MIWLQENITLVIGFILAVAFCIDTYVLYYSEGSIRRYSSTYRWFTVGMLMCGSGLLLLALSMQDTLSPLEIMLTMCGVCAYRVSLGHNIHGDASTGDFLYVTSLYSSMVIITTVAIG